MDQRSVKRAHYFSDDSFTEYSTNEDVANLALFLVPMSQLAAQALCFYPWWLHSSLKLDACRVSGGLKIFKRKTAENKHLYIVL